MALLDTAPHGRTAGGGEVGMTKEEAIKWLGNLIGDICQTRGMYLWPYAQALQEIITMLSDRNAVQQWISVKDRLPDAAGYECIVCAVNENYNQTHVFTAHTGYGEPGWWTSNVHYMSRATSPSDNRLHPALKVTHWMPLPEPPKEADKCDTPTT